jgi:hypothetical protein
LSVTLIVWGLAVGQLAALQPLVGWGVLPSPLLEAVIEPLPEPAWPVDADPLADGPRALPVVAGAPDVPRVAVVSAPAFADSLPALPP